MKAHSHIGFWVLSFLIAVLLAPALTSPTTIFDRLNSEVDSVKSTFGPFVGGGLVKLANIAHQAVSATGAEGVVREGIHSESERMQAETHLSVIGTLAVDTANDYFGGLVLQLYGVVLRALIVGLWAILLVPFVIAVCIDGVSMRGAKLADLGHQNPTAFSLAAHLLIILMALPLMYIAAPLPLPATFMLWWSVIVAVPAGFAIRHMQPILTH